MTNTNMLISAPEYKDAIVTAKQNAYEGYISILVSKAEKSENRYGYVVEKDGDVVTRFIEKPEKIIEVKFIRTLAS